MEGRNAMSRLAAGRHAPVALLLLAVLATPARAGDEAAAMPATNPLDAIATSSLSAFRTRPLFAPSRAEPAVPEAPPPMPAAAPPPPPPAEPPALKLVGIIDGRTRIAVVHLGDSAKTRMLASGDMLDNWRVTVLGTALRLTSGDRSIDIALFHSASAGTRPMPKPGEPPPDTASPADSPPDRSAP